MRATPAAGARHIACATFTLILAIVANGCAFDIVSVKQTPTALTALRAEALDFTLEQDVSAAIGTGFPTRLKRGTTWRQVGIVDQGAVFTTRDQIVTVEASNVHEAQVVISNGRLVGFYLPVERTFTPVSSPIPLETKPITSKP